MAINLLACRGGGPFNMAKRNLWKKIAFVKKGAPRYDGFVDGLITQHHQGDALTMKFKQSEEQNQRI
jgi:hypothetical protein